MPAPLSHIRVVEIGSFIAVPAAAALLADLGADVIKVEVPSGDLLRTGTPRSAGFSRRGFHVSPSFEMSNRGKRSITLDLKRPAARAALMRIVDGADVVMTNLLPDRQRRFGVDAASLRATRRALVFAAVSGYGGGGAEANRPAFDFAAFWARTGMMDIMHDAGQEPAWQRGGIGDHASALSLVCAILAALRVRDATGEGQDVEVSLMHTGFYLLGSDVSMSLVSGENPRRHDRAHAANPLWNQYRTRDDRWVYLAMAESNRYFAPLCMQIGRPDLATDARFVDAPARFRNSEALVAVLGSVFVERTLAEWEARLDPAAIIWAPVRTVAEAVNDPQAAATGAFPIVDHPTQGRFRTVAPPMRMSRHAMPCDRPAPDLGADSKDILAEAGLDPDEIQAALGTDESPA